MLRRKDVWRACGSLLIALALFATAYAGRVEIEIAAEPGVNTATAAQKWTTTLGEMGVAARFREPQPGDLVQIVPEGAGDNVTWRVTAQLNRRGQLVTPAGQFGLSDGPKLRQWLEQLRDTRPEDLGRPKPPFDLTHRQFDELSRTLAAPVAFSTKGLPPRKAVEQIVAGVKLPLAIDPAIERALDADDPLRDELQGISSGTALAAISRPAGAALVPRAVAGSVELAILPSQTAGDSWPIGWPPKEKDDGKVIPTLFEFLNVEIDGIAAAEAIAAIQGRLKTPLLMDHNNMARHRIDLNVEVKIPAGRTYYKRALDRVLFQAGLKAEVRVDDAGKPLLWVTTLKP